MDIPKRFITVGTAAQQHFSSPMQTKMNDRLKRFRLKAKIPFVDV